MMWTSTLIRRAHSEINVYFVVFGCVHLLIKIRATLHVLYIARLTMGLYFFSVINITTDHISQTFSRPNQNHEWKRNGKENHRLLIHVCLGVIYELWLGPYTLGIGAFASILAPEELHSVWVKDLLVVYIYCVLTELIRHGIGKICSPSLCKNNRGSSFTKEGIVKSCRFGLKKVDRIQGFEIIVCCVFIGKRSHTHFTIHELYLISFFKVRTLVFRMQTIYLVKLLLVYVAHIMRRYRQEGKSC